MAFPWPAEILSAYEQARTSEAPLGERLRIIAEVVGTRFPGFTEIADEFVRRLGSVCAGKSAPDVGDRLPDFLLPDQDGKLVSLHSVLEAGPAIIAFHRGHWCPYCHLNMTALADVEDEVRPAQIVAISPETQHYTHLLREETGAHFPFLTDVGAAYAMSLNLAIWIDQKFSRVIAESGCDVPLYNNSDSWILPIPAIFVVDSMGVITARHIDPDYRQRMEIDELLRCVEHFR